MRTVAHGWWIAALSQSAASSVKTGVGGQARAPGHRDALERLVAAAGAQQLGQRDLDRIVGAHDGEPGAAPLVAREHPVRVQPARRPSGPRSAASGTGPSRAALPGWRRRSRGTPTRGVMRGRDQLAVGRDDDVGLRGQPRLVQRVDGRQLLRRQAQEVVGPAPVDVGVQRAQVFALRPPLRSASGVSGSLSAGDRVGARRDAART